MFTYFRNVHNFHKFLTYFITLDMLRDFRDFLNVCNFRIFHSFCNFPNVNSCFAILTTFTIFTTVLKHLSTAAQVSLNVPPLYCACSITFSQLFRNCALTCLEIHNFTGFAAYQGMCPSIIKHCCGVNFGGFLRNELQQPFRKLCSMRSKMCYNRGGSFHHGPYASSTIWIFLTSLTVHNFHNVSQFSQKVCYYSNFTNSASYQFPFVS